MYEEAIDEGDDEGALFETKPNEANRNTPNTTHLTVHVGGIVYLYTLAVSPSLGGSRQHKRNNKNNGGFTPF